MEQKLPLTGLITALAVILIAASSVAAVGVLRAIPQPQTGTASAADQIASPPAWAAAVEFRVRSADQSPGAALFSQYSCETCHSTPNTVGPSIGGIGARAAARRVPAYSAAAYLYESITDPNAYVVPGYPAGVMPQNFKVVIPQDQLYSLVAWLLTQ
jgi:cytochrome c551/c552